MHVKDLFQFPTVKRFPVTPPPHAPLPIILRLVQDKTITGLAVQRKRIPMMAQSHCLLGWFSHLFPFIIMPNVI